MFDCLMLRPTAFLKQYSTRNPKRELCTPNPGLVPVPTQGPIRPRIGKLGAHALRNLAPKMSVPSKQSQVVYVESLPAALALLLGWQAFFREPVPEAPEAEADEGHKLRVCVGFLSSFHVGPQVRKGDLL